MEVMVCLLNLFYKILENLTINEIQNKKPTEPFYCFLKRSRVKMSVENSKKTSPANIKKKIEKEDYCEKEFEKKDNNTKIFIS